jgi:hypothetical protein
MLDWVSAHGRDIAEFAFLMWLIFSLIPALYETRELTRKNRDLLGQLRTQLLELEQKVDQSRISN